jgi:dTDP-4-dehydrorhamnose reductase
VTGASGLLGATLTLEALDAAYETAAISHSHPVTFPDAETIGADLTDAEAALDVIGRFRPQWVVHCAALVDVDRCEASPEEATRCNVDMTRNVAVAAKRFGAGLVYVSTDSVFDGTTGGYREDDQPAPVNAYARSKLDGEMAAIEGHGHPLIVRTNIYGWNATEKLSLAEWILGRLESSQKVPGFSDVLFTPILVNDLSVLIFRMMEMRLTGLYHVAGSEVCSKRDFACAVARVFGFDEGLVEVASIEDSELRAPRPANASLRTEKIARTLGQPMPDLSSGLRRFRELRESGFSGRLKEIGGVTHG